jgi:hypothetical protein
MLISPKSSDTGVGHVFRHQYPSQRHSFYTEAGSPLAVSRNGYIRAHGRDGGAGTGLETGDSCRMGEALVLRNVAQARGHGAVL